MKTDQLNVLHAIKNSRTWIGAQVIGEIVGMGERQVRATVKELVEKHKEPIVSMPGEGGGFRYVEDPKELAENCSRLLRLAFSVLRRARAFDKTGRIERLLGQQELGLSK